MSSGPLQDDPEVNEARATLFRALGDSTRLDIFQTLVEADDPLNVSELCARTGLSYNLVSHHLQCLKNCGLVEAEMESRTRFYRVAQETAPRLLDLADECIQQNTNSVLESEIAVESNKTDTDF